MDSEERKKLEVLVERSELSLKCAAHTWFHSKSLLGHFNGMEPAMAKIHIENRLISLIIEGMGQDIDTLKESMVNVILKADLSKLKTK